MDKGELQSGELVFVSWGNKGQADNVGILTGNNHAIISTFGGTASMMSGVAAAAKSLKLKDYHVLGIAGDGATADIGIQALSGAIDRGDKVIYICYDNEAYMNTGIQKSSLTPFGAKTTTTPAGKNIHGTLTQKKNMFEIIAAHDIEYAATASIGYVQDFLNKVERASRCNGTSYIHVVAPCPTGWGVPTHETINIAKEIVDSGLWYLAEYENEIGRASCRERVCEDVKILGVDDAINTNNHETN